MENLQIIDFERKGNVVRFYFGKNGEQWGDDWNDAPYDCNAGVVSPQNVVCVRDVAFPFDTLVLEPCDGVTNCNYSKEDMIARRVPCIIAVPDTEYEDCCFHDDDFYYWVSNDNVEKFYFGDTLEEHGYVYNN